MNAVFLVAGLIFIVGYALIALEHTVKLNKSATALITGALLWILVAVTQGEEALEEITHAGSEIFAIVVFLLAAMSLVEILAHYNFFDVIRGKLFKQGLTERQQFLIITLLAFLLSAVVDNLTTTIIMIQISHKFFKGENLLRAAAAVVIAANAGGAFSPIGDVTTVMLWFADKFEATEILTRGILPSIALYVVSIGIMYFGIKPSNYDAKNGIVTRLVRSEKIVVTITFLSFLLPIALSLVGLPPYIGLLFGLGVVWAIIDTMKRYVPYETHLNAAIEHFIQKTDISSLKFFIGILLAVSALHALGLLEKLAEFVYGADPSELTIIAGNVGLGLISSILDNVPLTAIAIDVLHTTNDSLWILLALMAGTGGSLLVIGSAAGVVAMGMTKGLTFGKYFKVAFVPAFLGVMAALGVWSVQYFVFGL